MSVVTVGNPYQQHYDQMSNTMLQAWSTLPRAPLAPAPAYRTPVPGSAEAVYERELSKPMHANHPSYVHMKAEHDEYTADPAAWHANNVARINQAWAPYGGPR